LHVRPKLQYLVTHYTETYRKKQQYVEPNTTYRILHVLRCVLRGVLWQYVVYYTTHVVVLCITRHTSNRGALYDMPYNLCVVVCVAARVCVAAARCVLYDTH